MRPLACIALGALLLVPATTSAQTASELGTPTTELSWEPAPRDDAPVWNPRVHHGFDDGWLYTGLAVALAGYALGVAFHVGEAFRECLPGYACNDWARPFAFVPLAHWATAFIGGRPAGDIGSVYPITGGITSGLELIGLALMLVGLLHHHPSLVPGGLAIELD